MAPHRVLVVDDESSLRFVLKSVLTGLGCDVTCCASGEEALPELASGPYSLALLDIVLPGMNGIEILRHLRQHSPDTEVIMMTSHASLETSIEAIREGAYDYLHKPFEFDEVSATVARALEKHRLLLENRELTAAREQKNQELTAAVQRLRALTAAGIGISSLSTVPEILDLMLDLVMTELDASRASIMLAEPDGHEMRIAAARGLEDEIIRTVRVRRGEGIAGRVLETGRLMLVTDIHQDERTAGSARSDLASSFLSAPIQLSVPIKSLDVVLGVVNLTNRQSGVPFGQEDAEFLSGLCGQVAVSIERARQTERLQESIGLLQSAQDQLLASERLNALGEMAAGVAHDFNNILNGIVGRSQLLLERLRRESPDREDLLGPIEMIEVLGQQGADAVRRIQDSARIRKERPTDTVDPNGVVRLVVELTRPRWEADRQGPPIEVHCDLCAVPLTTGNSLDLVQALSNIVFNAVEAMPAGGHLTFRSRHEDDSIRIDITDTGIGMSPEMRSHLFLPFHTTKTDGHGLGLSIVYGIISRLGGTVEAESTEGVGTTFTIRLPVRAPESHAPTARSPLESAPPRHARILVVEDEDYNREFYKESLALDGHHVTAVADGAEALAVFDAKPFDVVITDLSMPGMPGWEVAAEVKRRRPSVPVLILSGWGAQIESDRAREVGVDHVLSKPINLADLLAAVRGVLAPAPARAPKPKRRKAA